MDAAQRAVTTNNEEVICGRALSNPVIFYAIALGCHGLMACLRVRTGRPRNDNVTGGNATQQSFGVASITYRRRPI